MCSVNIFNRWITVALVSLYFFSVASANTEYDEGRVFLANKNLSEAHSSFEDSIEADSSFVDAYVFRAVTRLLILLESTEFHELFEEGGGKTIGSDFYNYHLDVNVDEDGVPIPDEEFVTDKVKAYVLTVVLLALEESMDDLEKVIDENYSLSLTPAEANTSYTVDIDYADIILAKSFLKAGLSMLHIAKNYDSNLVLYDLYELHTSDNLNIQSFLALYPQYFARMSGDQLGYAKNLFCGGIDEDETLVVGAVEDYNTARDIIKARQDEDYLFDLHDENVADEIDFKEYLDKVVLSIDTPTSINISQLDREVTLSLEPLFAGTVWPQDLYPEFYENYLVEGTIPDVHFDGLFPNLTEQDIYNEVTLGRYPKFIYGLCDQSFLEGTSHYLWAYSVGSPAVEYQWYRDEVPIQGDGSFLTFDKFMIGDSGTYSLKATNPIGSVVSGPIELTVLPSYINIEDWKDDMLEGYSDLDTADVDNDGRSNLLEYAQGTDPVNNDSPVTITSYDSGSDSLEFTYNKFRMDVDYSVEACNDLSSWSTDGVDQGSSDLGETTASVQVSPDTRKFIRLKISN